VTAIFLSWVVSALAILALTRILTLTLKRRWFWILVDSRGRCSLTQFQLAMWTLVILSLVSGIFFGRLIDKANPPLGFSIPSDVLGLLGISLGSAAVATTAKSIKNVTAPSSVAASNSNDPPRLAQIFLAEEGAFADQVIDIAKFQNFVITLVLLVAYAALAAHEIHHRKTASAVTALPTISGTFLTLLGISHGAYVLGKVPTSSGSPAGLTMQIVANQGRDAQPHDGQARNG